MESIVRTATNTGGGVTCPFSDEGAVATEGSRLAKGVQLMPTDLIEPRSDSKAKAAENNLCGKEKRRGGEERGREGRGGERERGRERERERGGKKRREKEGRREGRKDPGEKGGRRFSCSLWGLKAWAAGGTCPLPSDQP